MSSNASPGWRAVQVGGALLVAIGGSLGLLANRRISAVKSTHRPDLDALMEPPVDIKRGSIGTTDGGKVDFVDTDPEGVDRPTVVLLHGITNQWWTWSSVLNNLRADHRVIAWDMRGFGASEAGTAGVDLGAAADDLRVLLTDLNLHRVVIVGHSMGGMVLGRFVADHGPTLRERVGGVQFLGTTGKALGGSFASGGLVRLTAFASELADRGISGARLKWENEDIAILLLRSGFGRVATAKMIDWSRRCQAETTEQSFQEGARSISAHNVLGSLGALATPTPIPTAIVVGSQDRLTPPLHALALKQAIPHAVLMKLEGVGHNVMYENPQAIVESVRALVSRSTVETNQQ